MNDNEKRLLKEILILMNGAVFPGKGRKANELGNIANDMLGEEVYKTRNIAGDKRSN